jgi:hypothetical protein
MRRSECVSPIAGKVVLIRFDNSSTTITCSGANCTYDPVGTQTHVKTERLMSASVRAWPGLVEIAEDLQSFSFYELTTGSISACFHRWWIARRGSAKLNQQFGRKWRQLLHSGSLSRRETSQYPRPPLSRFRMTRASNDAPSCLQANIADRAAPPQSVAGLSPSQTHSL